MKLAARVSLVLFFLGAALVTARIALSYRAYQRATAGSGDPVMTARQKAIQGGDGSYSVQVDRLPAIGP